MKKTEKAIEEGRGSALFWLQKKNKNAKNGAKTAKNGGFVRKLAAKIAKFGGLAGKNCEKSKIGS